MLNAKDAKDLTTEALMPQSEIVKPYLVSIEAMVKLAASKGSRSITHPFLGKPLPSEQVQEAVRLAVENLNYTWTDYPDPDPGSPVSGPYTTVSW